MVVYIENKYLDESYLLSQDQQFGELRPKLQTFEDGKYLAVPYKIKILQTVLLKIYYGEIFIINKNSKTI